MENLNKDAMSEVIKYLDPKDILSLSITSNKIKTVIPNSVIEKSLKENSVSKLYVLMEEYGEYSDYSFNIRGVYNSLKNAVIGNLASYGFPKTVSARDKSALNTFSDGKWTYNNCEDECLYIREFTSNYTTDAISSYDPDIKIIYRFVEGILIKYSCKRVEPDGLKISLKEFKSKDLIVNNHDWWDIIPDHSFTMEPFPELSAFDFNHRMVD